MHNLTRFIFAITLFWFFIPGVSFADFNRGLEAYNRGDYATAMREWKSDAAQGNFVAQYNVGYLYESGQGVSQNYSEAARWYRLAADKGYALAQLNLGAIPTWNEVLWCRKPVYQSTRKIQEQEEIILK